MEFENFKSTVVVTDRYNADLTEAMNYTEIAG
jgi:hypothetical protein